MAHYRPIILAFLDYYLPGYRAGGPIRTISNFVDHFGDEFEILIVTRDRDVLDIKSYTAINVDSWTSVGKAKVYYASEKMSSFSGVVRILNETPCDILYLNSFFSFNFTVLPLIVRLLGLVPKMPCVLAPRGEFSSGALKIKKNRKKIFLLFAKIVQLNKGLIWQASSVYERKDIACTMGALAKDIIVAPDLLPKVITDISSLGYYPAKSTSKKLRIVFLSRVSPMKNLNYLLSILQKVNESIEVFIYGTLEDVSYWEECKRSIGKLPSNISVNYFGSVNPVDVCDKFAEHDVFFFPTLGENFGHVIFESLSVGTCVVLSDQTLWQNDDEGAVQVIPLSDEDSWVQAVVKWAGYSDEELIELRKSALSYAQEYLATSTAVQQNRDLFTFALD